MASTPIPNPTWLTILSKLGIQRVGSFFLSDQVLPVALVDSEITLSATTVPTLFGTPASAGELVAPAANTRLADTGALAAGTWTFFLSFGQTETNPLRIRRRNAADAADIWSTMVALNAWTFGTWSLRTTVAANERLVVENPVVGAAGKTYQASIFAVLS